MILPIDDAKREASECVDERIRMGEILPIHIKANKRADSGWYWQDRVTGALVKYAAWRELHECRIDDAPQQRNHAG